ncbi:hypothetical protein ANTQUA_LOCUS3876 [Anthophora quadrimaculata]
MIKRPGIDNGQAIPVERVKIEWKARAREQAKMGGSHHELRGQERVSIFKAIKERERWFSRGPRISEQDPFDLAHTPPIDQAEPLGRTKPPCHGLTINLQPAE